MKKGIIFFIGIFLAVAEIMTVTAVAAGDTENGTKQYSGELIVPKTSYQITLGAYILDGSDVWTKEEEQRVVSREGLICTWVHNGKSEGLADYDSKTYPDYKHYCENQDVFAPCYVIINGEDERMYTEYNQFQEELNKVNLASGSYDQVEVYKAFYGKSPGSTNYVFKNGNLSVTIPITVYDASIPVVDQPEQRYTDEESINENQEMVDQSADADNLNQNMNDWEKAASMLETGGTDDNESMLSNQTNEKSNASTISNATKNAKENERENSTATPDSSVKDPTANSFLHSSNSAALLLVIIPVLLVAAVFYFLIYKNKKH